VPGGGLFAGPFSPAAFAGVELIAISPGVPAAGAAGSGSACAGHPGVSEIELFVWGLRQ
jgi:UDP-N-acetylmuramoylalanine--D-glutamate ligase